MYLRQDDGDIDSRAGQKREFVTDQAILVSARYVAM